MRQITAARVQMDLPAVAVRTVLIIAATRNVHKTVSVSTYRQAIAAAVTMVISENTASLK